MTIHTDKTHASSAYLRRYVPVLLCYMAALYSCAINAAPFTTYDGRSAALAGVAAKTRAAIATTAITNTTGNLLHLMTSLLQRKWCRRHGLQRALERKPKRHER